MIVTEQDGELWVMRQEDHGRQAGEMARLWGDGSAERPGLDGAVCLAIEKHDFGWRKPDSQVLYDSEAGRPLDFRKIDLRNHLEFYRSGYEEALALDPYSGMMVGMHWIGLYTRRFGYDPTFAYEIPGELAATFEETVAWQEKEWVDIKRGLWSTSERRRDFEDRVWMHYEVVQAMDRLSLFLHMTGPNQRADVTLGPVRFRVDAPMEQVSVRAYGNGEISLSPFPFGEQFRTAITVRRIPNERYESPERLRDLLEGVEDESMEFLVRPSE